MGRRAKTADPASKSGRASARKRAAKAASKRRAAKSPAKGKRPPKKVVPRPSTTGHARTGTPASQASRKPSGDDMSGELSRIQIQTGVFQKKTAKDREVVDRLKQQIEDTRKKIMGYRRNMGGETALTNNDRFVRHQVHIMEKRVKNSAVEYMRACENNRQLRMAVNDLRRYRMIQLEVKGRIQTDLKELDDRNEELAASMTSTQRELQRVENNIEQEKKVAAQQAAEEEAKWRALDQDPSDINLNVLTETRNALPKVGGAASPPRRGGLFDENPRRGRMSLAEEKKMRGKLIAHKWESAILTSEEAKLAQKLTRYRETFAEVRKALGVRDIDEFNETFSAREDQNFAIVQHINGLNEEAAQLEEEIDAVKRKATHFVQTCATDNRPRKRISEQLDKKLHATVAKYLWYEERLTDLMGVAQTFRRSIGNLYAFLHGINKSSNEDIPGLTELNMIKYLGSIENEVFKLLKRYLKQHAFPSVARPTSRASARSSTPDRRAASPEARGSSLVLPESPIVGAASKLLQGPSESTGKLAHLHVVAPSVATVSALAANAAVDDDASFGGDDLMDAGNDTWKPLSLDALRRSAMTLQATGEMNLTRTAALDLGLSKGTAGAGGGSGKRGSRRSSPTNNGHGNGHPLSSTIPALHMGGSRPSRRRRDDAARNRARLNKTVA